MGKLHKIRKAIEKTPSIWKEYYSAVFRNGKWIPVHAYESGNPKSYRNFVKSVVKKLARLGKVQKGKK